MQCGGGLLCGVRGAEQTGGWVGALLYYTNKCVAIIILEWIYIVLSLANHCRNRNWMLLVLRSTCIYCIYRGARPHFEKKKLVFVSV